MVRLPIPPERLGPRVRLTREEQHYLCDVLRLERGARVEVFDGKGHRWPAELVSEDELRLGDRSDEALPTRAVVLAQALVKGEKMELVVQKATELGATAVAPFAAARSVVKLDEKRAAQRLARWQKIASEAARQCGRADALEVRPVATLDAVIREGKAASASVLLLFEGERTVGLREALARSDGPVVLVVGPEGGFEAAEVEGAQALGAIAVSLGRLTLRTETAGLAALCVAKVLEGELG